MPISFNNIPANLRVPGVYIEFDAARAGSLSQQQKLLVIGQRRNTGSVDEGVPKRVFNAGQAEDYFGRGSMLAEMFHFLKGADQFVETWAVALDDDGEGAAASGSVTFTGPASRAGTVYTYIAGYRITTAVEQADAAADIATAVVADINDNTRLPVTAAINGITPEQVDLTCRWNGETGNDIDVRFNYFEGEGFPAGVGATVTAMSGGTNNPDVTTAIAAIGAEKYDWIAMPYTDDLNLSALESELDDRWGPTEQNDGRAFIAFRDNLANTTTFGTADGRNSPHVTCMGTNIAPEPPYIWAAVNSVVAGAALAIDPARQLRTRILDGLKPPARDVRWTNTERNSLLFDGISTYAVDAGDRVRIEAQITMYQQTVAGAGGVDDDSFLYINTTETLSRIRQEQIAMFLTRFPNAKLAPDSSGTFAGNQAVMQPKKARDLLLALYLELVEQRVWCVDYEHYKDTLVVEIDPDNSQRLNVRDEPTIVGNYRIHAQKTQFRT